MPDQAAAGTQRKFAPARAVLRAGSGLVLVAAVGFIGHRLVSLEPGALARQASWPLAGAALAAAGLFGSANHALARAWALLADPAGTLSIRQAEGIYGRGVLTKYLPGSVFQYITRQIGGREAGLSHGTLARSSIDEALLHVAASLSVAATLVAGKAAPLMAVAALLGMMVLLWRSGRARLRALALQIVAFSGFAAAAAVMAWALFPAGTAIAGFAGLFLVAWLAGFLIPVAPGGLGVREAALVALSSALVAPALVLAAVLALRIASVTGDLLYGIAAVARSRRG